MAMMDLGAAGGSGKIMWLLKLHFSISVLCMLTGIGFRTVYRQQIKDNGWIDGGKVKKKSIFGYFMFFVPIMNILTVILMFVMIGMKKNDFDKMCEDAKSNEASGHEKSRIA